MTETQLINGESIRETFREWHAEQESLDAQLDESLQALSAYQSHLDSWQQQLARERDELREARGQLELDCAAAEKNQACHAQAVELAGELSAAREKISSLSVSLLSRTEELRSTDERRAELATELELARNYERELRAALEEQRQTSEQERLHRAEELRNLRELLKCGVEAAPLAESHTDGAAPVETQRPRPSAENGPAKIHENPVLGSIVEQFGKLRQQRAQDRQTFRKSR